MLENKYNYIEARGGYSGFRKNVINIFSSLIKECNLKVITSRNSLIILENRNIKILISYDAFEDSVVFWLNIKNRKDIIEVDIPILFLATGKSKKEWKKFFPLSTAPKHTIERTKDILYFYHNLMKNVFFDIMKGDFYYKDSYFKLLEK